MIKLTDEDKRYLIEGIAKSISAYAYQVGGPSSYSKSDLFEKLDKMHDLITSLEK